MDPLRNPLAERHSELDVLEEFDLLAEFDCEEEEEESDEDG